MTIEEIGSTAAVVIAAVSVFFAMRAAKAARDQTVIAREQTDIAIQVRKDSAQPYVWADIRPDP